MRKHFRNTAQRCNGENAENSIPHTKSKAFFMHQGEKRIKADKVKKAISHGDTEKYDKVKNIKISPKAFDCRSALIM